MFKPYDYDLEDIERTKIVYEPYYSAKSILYRTCIFTLTWFSVYTVVLLFYFSIKHYLKS